MSRSPNFLGTSRVGVLKPYRPVLSLIAALSLAVLPCCAEVGGNEALDTETETVTPDAGTESGWGLPAGPASGATGGSASTPPQSSTPALDTSDAGTYTPGAGEPATRDAGASSGGAGSDAGSSIDLGGILGGLLGGEGDGGSVDADGGFTPPSTDGGEWSLDDGSFVDCPAEPPPIPIIGGICAGVYFFCTWTNQSGEQYTCTCDWVHWLCV